MLVVEDNIVNQMYAESLLQGFGCATRIANNGLEAVQAVQETAFDLVLMDCQMPVMDGFAATRRIAEHARAGAVTATPVIALTANAMKGDRERCFEAGMCDYLAKPVREQTLAAVAARWTAPVAAPASSGGVAIAVAPAASGSPPHAPAPARAALAAARATVGQRFGEMVERFAVDMERAVAAMPAAAAAGDLAACARVAHGVKSSAAVLGAAALAEAARDLELLARVEDATAASVAPAARMFAEAFEAVLAELRAAA